MNTSTATKLTQHAASCTSGAPPATLCIDLKGGPDGMVTNLDNGGPLDAPDRLPMGGAWSQPVPSGFVLGFSVQRAGDLA